MLARIPALATVFAPVLATACGSSSPRPVKLSNTATPPVERMLDPAVRCAPGSSCTIAWRDGAHEIRATYTGRIGADFAIDIDGVRQTDAPTIREGVVIGLDAADLDGDGHVDLVAWIDPHTGPKSEIDRDTVVFLTVADQPGAFAEDPWSSAALGVVPDSATLHREARTLRTFAMPDDTMPTQQLLLRLTFATTAELIGVISPDGLDTCQTASGNATPHPPRCHHYRRDEVNDAVLIDLIQRVGPGETPMYPGLYGCTTVGSISTCLSGTGGPATMTYTFRGVGSARRLAEIDIDIYENS